MTVLEAIVNSFSLLGAIMNLTKTTTTVILGVLLVFGGYGAFILYKIWPVSEYSIATAGTFGDSFGVVTSLFSGLAFAGIILTILLQRRELTESREIFRIQRFEGSFYRLLELYRRNLEDVRVVDHEDKVYEGIGALSFYSKKFSESMKRHVSYLEVDHGRAVYEYHLFVEIQRNIVRQSRYLGTLQNILELIERDLPSDEERVPYWDIVASQITFSEAKYIFYCCLVSGKNDRFRALMERSGLIVGLISSSNISSTLRASYKRVHGIELVKLPVKLILPCTRKKLREQTRLAKVSLREAAAAKASKRSILPVAS